MKNLPDQPETFSTADLGIAVFLITLGHELVRTNVIDQRRLVFHFRRKDNTDSLISKYLTGDAKAPAKKLFENYRSLRALAFAGTNNLK